MLFCLGCALLPFDILGCQASSHPACPPITSLLAVSVQVSERGGARKEQEKQNGGLFEEEATPKQHRKPERTLRYTHTRQLNS